MKSLTDKELIEFLSKLVDEQYGDAVDDYDIDNMEWVPAEPEIKSKIPEPNNWGTMDLTNVLSSKLKEEILKFSNLKVGTFKIKINRYSGAPSQEGAKLCMDLEVKEARTHTPNGVACGPAGVEYAVDLPKDSRFKTCSWLKYFNEKGCAHNVPIDVVVQIIRWFQLAKKLSA